MTHQAFPPSREAALARLDTFVERAGRHYAANRNHDLGPADRSNVSMLSPYLRHRLLTEQEVVAAVVAKHSEAAAEKFIQEVVWRTYWKGWLEQRPQIWERYQGDVAALQGAAVPALREKLGRAMSGATGIACFDAWARELVETGYLHNHARMWFASIWIFTLKLPWQLGADFFLRHLLDGDAASNTLSWRWVGGLHTQGKCYLARADNIAAFTNGRFSSTDELATVAEALPADAPVERQPLAALPAMPLSPPSVVIVTEDDLGIETCPINWPSVRTVVLLDTAASLALVASPVVAFKRAALADTHERLKSRLPRAATVASLTVRDAIAALEALPRGASIAMYEMPVGPARTAAAPLLRAITQQGHGLQCLRRPWDAAFWPHATAGFFKVKAKIPQTLKVVLKEVTA